MKEKNMKLRRRVCLKLAKKIESNFNIEKSKAQELTLKIENKIRVLNPYLDDEYKDKIIIILKLIKVQILESNLTHMNNIISTLNWILKNF